MSAAAALHIALIGAGLALCLIPTKTRRADWIWLACMLAWFAVSGATLLAGHALPAHFV